ncbi:MAG: helix-turn-helix domain-containing protein [Oscillospiraceae bacterium]|nr:helix-turn-helix domain-containing protein [Oscillospiraceae bacterium]
MNINLGNKIRELRKQKNISQDVLANYLGVTFQAVSKWENDTTMPDVTLIPAIASFFGVSTDELFDFNLYEIEKKVNFITDEYSKYYDSDRAKSEAILRDGLKKYPGNDTLLNCLIGTIPVPERSGEVIELCKALIESTKSDDVKYDSYRIMEAYKSIGEYTLAKAAIEKIPEIYFTKLQIAALLLDGEDMYEAAVKQKSISLGHLLEMLDRLADYYIKNGDSQKSLIQLQIGKSVIEAFINDFSTKYTKKPFETFKTDLDEFERKIKEQST